MRHSRKDGRRPTRVAADIRREIGPITFFANPVDALGKGNPSGPILSHIEYGCGGFVEFQECFRGGGFGCVASVEIIEGCELGLDDDRDLYHAELESVQLGQCHIQGAYCFMGHVRRNDCYVVVEDHAGDTLLFMMTKDEAALVREEMASSGRFFGFDPSDYCHCFIAAWELSSARLLEANPFQTSDGGRSVALWLSSCKAKRTVPGGFEDRSRDEEMLRDVICSVILYGAKSRGKDGSDDPKDYFEDAEWDSLRMLMSV